MFEVDRVIAPNSPDAGDGTNALKHYFVTANDKTSNQNGGISHRALSLQIATLPCETALVLQFLTRIEKLDSMRMHARLSASSSR